MRRIVTIFIILTLTAALLAGCTLTPESVLEVIAAFEKACGHEIPYQIMERRPGDIAVCYADTKKAEELLGFKAEYDIDRMCEDSYRFTCNLRKE